MHAHVSQNVVLLLMAAVASALLAFTRQRTDFSHDLSAYRPMSHVRVQVVVARYAEDVSWLEHLPFRDVIVYDKGWSESHDAGNPPPGARVEQLPNVGRCDHTYLHHVVEKWDQLADVTIFVPGSCASFRSKWNKLKWVVSHVSRTGDSAFPLDGIASHPIYKGLGEFKLDSYRATASVNASANPEWDLQPCRHRPYSVFFQQNFPELPPVREVVYQGVFAVSRQHVRQTPKKRYLKLLSYLDTHSNPEAGHFMERSWLAAFYPVPERCMYVGQNWDGETSSGNDLVFVLTSCIMLLLLLVACINKIS